MTKKDYINLVKENGNLFDVVNYNALTDTFINYNSILNGRHMEVIKSCIITDFTDGRNTYIPVKKYFNKYFNEWVDKFELEDGELIVTDDSESNLYDIVNECANDIANWITNNRHSLFRKAELGFHGSYTSNDPEWEDIINGIVSYAMSIN